MRHTLFFFSLIGFMMISCLVPIQMSRVTLTENFTQSFSFASGMNNEGPTKILEKLISGERVDMLWESPEGINILSQLQEGTVVSKGISVLTISLVPDQKPEKFFISGVGFYDIVDTISSKVYFTARFYLVEEVHPLSMLNTASSIPLYFKQVLVNQIAYPDGLTREHKPADNASIRIDVFINRSILNVTGKPVFGLDYSAKHPVSIQGDLIGHITFRSPLSPFDKIIDMRGLKPFVRRDYRKFRPLYEANK